jgi:tetratricopeptide (TPR) repeat protein
MMASPREVAATASCGTFAPSVTRRTSQVEPIRRDGMPRDSVPGMGRHTGTRKRLPESQLKDDDYRAAANRLGEGNALHNLGSVQQRTGDFPAALETLTRALALQQAVGNSIGEASVLTNLGSVQYRSGNYATATTSLARALELHRALGNRLGEANTLNELGIAKSLTGQHNAAIADLRSHCSISCGP